MLFGIERNKRVPPLFSVYRPRKAITSNTPIVADVRGPSLQTPSNPLFGNASFRDPSSPIRFVTSTMNLNRLTRRAPGRGQMMNFNPQTHSRS